MLAALSQRTAEQDCAFRAAYNFITHRSGGKVIRNSATLCARGGRHRGPRGPAINMKIFDIPQSGKTGQMVSCKIGKYGVPRAGSRVIIRTLQQINGWEDIPKQMNAIVPAA